MSIVRVTLACTALLRLGNGRVDRPSKGSQGWDFTQTDEDDIPLSNY